MRRVAVVGNSGAGKSTLAAGLARRLGVPWLELDGVYHQPGWTPLPVDELRARVDAFTRQPGWVVDGNYSVVRELVWSRADTVVWLDLPKRVVMWRVVRRTLGRLVRRTELWNGNRESWRSLVTTDPQRSIIAWSWQRHAVYRARFEAASRDPAWGRLTFVRLRSRRDVERFAASSAPG
jgi:adenylate kinase family enzyme